MFEILNTDGRARRGVLHTVHGDIQTPVFMNVGTCAAIKAGREYATEHIKWIVDKLMEIDDITVCPHGRPVAMELSHKQLDKQFERC